MRDLQRRATTLLAAAVLAIAILLAGMLAGGWMPSVIGSGVEKVFWIGSVIGATAVILIGGAAFPTERSDAGMLRRKNRYLQVGLVLFAIAPLVMLVPLVIDHRV